jgi:hypothetical protein
MMIFRKPRLVKAGEVRTGIDFNQDRMLTATSFQPGIYFFLRMRAYPPEMSSVIATPRRKE